MQGGPYCNMRCSPLPLPPRAWTPVTDSWGLIPVLSWSNSTPCPGASRLLPSPSLLPGFLSPVFTLSSFLSLSLSFYPEMEPPKCPLGFSKACNRRLKTKEGKRRGFLLLPGMQMRQKETMEGWVGETRAGLQRQPLCPLRGRGAGNQWLRGQPPRLHTWLWLQTDLYSSSNEADSTIYYLEQVTEYLSLSFFIRKMGIIGKPIAEPHWENKVYKCM